jgi:hypothetical protein
MPKKQTQKKTRIKTNPMCNVGDDGSTKPSCFFHWQQVTMSPPRIKPNKTGQPKVGSSYILLFLLVFFPGIEKNVIFLDFFG